MSKERLTIGALSRRSGVRIKTLRFYSDQGLLPPAGRTRSGYRIYGDDALLRIDLIRTLREAGLGLESIRAVLGRDMTLGDALRLRLRALEAQITALQRVSAAIRVAIRSEPTENDIRRLHAVTRLSNEERKQVIERFFAEVSRGIPIDQEWSRRMIEASTPKLPEQPTAEQLDAWIELSEIVSDPSFIQTMRESAARTWKEGFNQASYKQATDAAVQEAREAMARSLPPSSPEASAIVERLVVAMAQASGRAPDAAFRAELRERYEKHDPRATRYWELVGILSGWPQGASTVEPWRWLNEASMAHLAP